MSKFVFAVILSLICLLTSLAWAVAEETDDGNPQIRGTVFRYGQFDRSPIRTVPIDQVKYYPFPNIRNADTSNPTWASLRTPLGNIVGTYTVYDTMLTQANFIATGDLENDGFEDLVSASYYDGYIAILHQSTTTHQLELVALWDVTQGGASNGVRDVFIVDMNADSLKDIVAFDALNGLVAIFQQTNQYGVFTRTEVGAGIMFSRGGVGDLNGDNLTDLLWTEGRNVYVAYQILSGFSSPVVFSVPANPYGILDQPAIGDVNGDGLPDLIVVDGYLVRLFVWVSPSMQLVTLGAPGNVSENVTVGDLDQDGIDDIAIPGGGTDQVAITWGGAFTPTILTGIGNLKDVAIGDLDDDGRMELVATDQQSYHLVIWNLDNRMPVRQIISANTIPGEIVIADLNGDELKDVAYGISGWTSPPHAPVTVHYQIILRFYFLPFVGIHR